MSYYPISNGWKLWYGKMVCSNINLYRILKNIELKMHNFSLELKQSKTLPAASCWIILTRVSEKVDFLIIEQSKSAGAKDNVSNICGLVQPLHPF